MIARGLNISSSRKNKVQKGFPRSRNIHSYERKRQVLYGQRVGQVVLGKRKNKRKESKCKFPAGETAGFIWKGQEL